MNKINFMALVAVIGSLAFIATSANAQEGFARKNERGYQDRVIVTQDGNLLPVIWGGVESTCDNNYGGC